MAVTQTSTQTLVDLLKHQRLAWSCAAIVGLFLVLVGHVPVLPVLLGCVLAITISILRTKYNFNRTNGLPGRR
jgi:hypothetical protein